MLDARYQRFLCGAGVRRNKDRVVATDIADHLRPVAPVEGESDALRRPDRSVYDEQIGLRWLFAAQQARDSCHMRVAVLVIAG